MGRPDSELYRGARLAAAMEWRATGDHRLSQLEREFLEAGDVEHQAVVARMEVEATRQRRLNRRLRGLVVGIAVLALVATGVGGAALVQWDRARDATAVAQAEADRARQEAARARSQELTTSAMAVMDQDPGLAKLLSILAAEASVPTSQAVDALHAAIESDRVVSRLGLYSAAAGGVMASLHPNGDRVVLSGASALDPSTPVEVQDPLTGELLWTQTLEDRRRLDPIVMWGARYTPDGRLLVAGKGWEPWAWLDLADPGPGRRGWAPPSGVAGIQLWDAQTHADLGLIDVGPCGGWPLAVSDTHALVTTIADDPLATDTCDWLRSSVELVDLTTGTHEVLSRDGGQESVLRGGAISGDGSVAAIDSGADVRLFEIPHGRLLAEWRRASIMDLDPSGSHAVVAVPDGEQVRFEVREVPGGAVVTEYRSPATQFPELAYAAFAGEGSMVVSTAADNVLRVWDSTTGQDLRAVPGVGTGVGMGPPQVSGSWALVPQGAGYFADFSDYFAVFAGAPQAPSVALVHLGSGSDTWRVAACEPRLTDLTPLIEAAAGVVLAARRCTTDAVGLADAEVFDDIGGERGVLRDAAWPEGRLQASSDGRDVVDPGPYVFGTDPRFSAEPESLMELSPDGQRVVRLAAQFQPGHAGSVDVIRRQIEVLEVASGRVVTRFEGLCAQRNVYLTGTSCRSFPAEPFSFRPVSANWSPDGQWVAVAGELFGRQSAATGAVVVWDGRTGELVASLYEPHLGEVPQQAVFSADGSRLVVAYPELLTGWDTDGWRRAGESASASSRGVWPAIAGVSAAGELVLVGDTETAEPQGIYLASDLDDLGSLRLIATQDFAEVDPSLSRVSPDGTRLAIATQHGLLSVWDLSTGTMVYRQVLGGEPLGSDFVQHEVLSDLDWLDDSTIVVALVTGEVVTYTPDPSSLLEEARRTLLRNLAPEECDQFGIEPCPAPGELRGEPPTVPEDLQGSYDLDWKSAELEDALREYYRRALGRAPGQAVFESGAAVHATALTGGVELTLGPQTFVLEGRDGQELCAGVARVEGGALLLDGVRGDSCPGVHYLRADYELRGQELRLDEATFHGDRAARVLWTTKPLQRVG